MDTDASPCSRSNGVARGYFRDNVDGDRSEEKIPNLQTQYEEKVEMEDNCPHPEFEVEMSKWSDDKRKHSRKMENRLDPSNSERQQESSEDATRIGGEEKKYPDYHHKSQHISEEKYYALPTFEEMQQQRDIGLRRTGPAPSYDPSGPLPHTKQRSMPMTEPDQEEPRKVEENEEYHGDPAPKSTPAPLPIYEQMMKMAADGRAKSPQEQKLAPHSASSSQKRGASEPILRSPDHKRSKPIPQPIGQPHTSDESTSKPTFIPVYEQMMREAAETRAGGTNPVLKPAHSLNSSDPKRGASQPVPLSSSEFKRPDSTPRSTTAPNASESASKPASLPIYEHMMREASAGGFQESVPFPASSTQTRGAPEPVGSSPPKPKRPKHTPTPTTAQVPSPPQRPKQPKLTPTSTIAQDSFNKYVETWNTLARHEPGWPYPNSQLTESGLFNKASIDPSARNLATLSDVTIISLNTQIFFLKGYDLAYTLLVVENKAKVVVSSIRNVVEEVNSLRGYLKKKELARWHPDRLNLRTGAERGEPDEKLGSLAVVAAVRTGVDELIERCEEAVLAAEKNGR